MWIALFSMALAGDRQEIDALNAQIDGYDASIQDSLAYLQHPEGDASALLERLSTDARELRPVMRKLDILEGRVGREGKQRDIDALAALRARISEQRKVRSFASSTLKGLVALQGEPDDNAWRTAETRVISGAKKWNGLPPDPWLVPLVDRAIEAERWAFVEGAAAWCAIVCSTPSVTERWTPRLPDKGYVADFRWKEVLEHAKTLDP